ncbi:myb-like protein AA [Musca domestica]|uniref:Myb-like protein AA n=1 Tax=Musca domestica TaxID=7370 RepID=A0ABM3VI06_MUSDO|nr:myb-like protein AA [Musca domestica]
MARSLSAYLNRNVDNEQYYPAPHQSQAHHHELMHQSSLAGQCQRHKANEVSVSFANRNENLGMLQLSRQQQQQQQQQLAAATSSNQQQQQQQQQQHQQYQNITPNPNWLPPQTNKRAPEEIDDQRQNAAAAAAATTLHGYRPESHQISQQTSYNSSSAAQQQQQHQQSLPYCTKHPENFLNNSPANDIGDLMGNYVAKKTYITPFDIPSPPPQPAEHKRFSSGQYVAKATCPSGPGEATATLSGGNSNIKSHCQCVEHNVRGSRNGGGCHLNHKHYPQTQTHQRPAAAGTSNSNNINNSSLTTSTQQQHRNHHHSHHYIDEPLNRTASLKHNNPAVGHHQQYPHHQHHQHPPPPPPHHQQHQPQYRKIDVFAAADDDDNDTSPSIKVRAKRVANFLLL